MHKAIGPEFVDDTGNRHFGLTLNHFSKAVQEAPEDYSGCVVKTFVDYPGHDLPDMPLVGVTSLSACADACRRHGSESAGAVRCGAFSFTVWRQCFLKTKAGEAQDSFGGSVSGVCT